jgi:hypothetical protein
VSKRIGVIAALTLACSPACFSQHFAYGVVAGTALTDDFNFFYLPPIYPGPETIQKAGGKSLIIGPMLEWSFSPHFSLEADGLFRELHYTTAHAGNQYPTVTWEFPILAKYRPFSYRMGRTAVRPFLEAGPSFRTIGNLNAYPSHTGISAGAGLDFRFSHFDIAPTLRYTRWARDNNPYGINTRPDQIELLVAFSHSANLGTHPFGHRFSIGAILGTNLIGDYNSQSSTYTDPLTGATNTFSHGAGPHSFLVGPAVEFRVTHNLSLEADAIYRPIQEHYSTHSESMGHTSTYSGSISFATWQFPLLAKYTVPIRFSKLKPFIEAGPSFRTGGSETHYGIAAGAGVSAQLGRLEIVPAVRYTRWQTRRFGQVRPDEADLLVGFLF